MGVEPDALGVGQVLDTVDLLDEHRLLVVVDHAVGGGDRRAQLERDEGGGVAVRGARRGHAGLAEEHGRGATADGSATEADVGLDADPEALEHLCERDGVAAVDVLVAGGIGPAAKQRIAVGDGVGLVAEE